MGNLKAEIISTGSEILKGFILDTNAQFLSLELQKLGIIPRFFTVVGDEEKNLKDTLKIALKRSQLIIITGGLGPTDDDINREIIAKIMKTKLILNEDAYKNIVQRFKKRGIKMPTINKKQTLIPESSIYLKNKWGTASAFILKKDEKIIIALPGPPREMIPIFHQYVKKYLRKKFNLKNRLIMRCIHTIGISESALNEILRSIIRKYADIKLSFVAHSGRVDILIGVTEKSKLVVGNRHACSLPKQIENEIKKLIREYIYGYDNDTLEGIVGKLLSNKHLTIATAESCTGGLIANRITDISGSSNYFIKGYVTYSIESKIQDLGVKKETIMKYGAVSKETAEEMALGAKKKARTDIAISTTGIAGPTGGTKEKPVGLVWFGLATSDGVFTTKRNFLGERTFIKLQTANTALDLIRKYLLNYKH